MRLRKVISPFSVCTCSNVDVCEPDDGCGELSCGRNARSVGLLVGELILELHGTRVLFKDDVYLATSSQIRGMTRRVKL